ncbi:glycerophosphodiester phosphodiesterase [Archangium minus]|uniref:Glycerophosphodiester phosphodiesterase n=1 Tax=Archangium minus TaxID=83450 RepID=A0ABY9WQ77_9BACT|nr:glycerophosphodiester phosphodiesterase [Archangium minus]
MKTHILRCWWLGSLIAVVGCGAELVSAEGAGEYAPETQATALVNDGYWADVSKPFPLTPRGHAVGICSHNTYVDSILGSARSLESTLSRVQAAIAADVDMIEFDLKEQNGQVYVDHDDDGGSTGALLANVLDSPALQADDAVLYLEIKETSSHASIARKILDILDARRTWYARAGRPVFIRSFHATRANLLETQKLLGQYPAISPYLRLHVLFSANQATHGLIQDAFSRGWHGVEFPYADANILSKIAYAKSLGLGVTLWTIPVNFGEVYLSNLREEVDAFVVDYDVAKARAVVSEDNQLLYLSVWKQPASGTSIRYHQTNATTYTAPVNVAGAPSTLADGTGENLYGTSLVFSAASALSMPFYDADTAAGQGYFVSAYVNFDDLLTSCPGGASSCTMALVSKSESGAFALELFRSSTGARTLRFGVHVAGGYQYATRSLSALNGTNSYLITGAYDGNGQVRLWVDNSSSGTTQSGSFTEGVRNSDVPVTLGADPQAGASPRFFLSGKVQMVQVLRWGDH